jgi:hypothetical protein
MCSAQTFDGLPRFLRAVENGTPEEKKQLIEELVNNVEITPERTANPYFRVPDMRTPGPFVSRACNWTRFRVCEDHAADDAAYPSAALLAT